MVSSILEALESSFTLMSNDDAVLSLKTAAIDVATNLLTLPTPAPVQMHTVALLAALHNTKAAYHLYKVRRFIKKWVILADFFLARSC